MEPTWPQDGQRCANRGQELNMAQESAKIAKIPELEPTWRGKVGPRWRSWSQDGAKMLQVGAKIAILGPLGELS